jgi:hypothetical protein
VPSATGLDLSEAILEFYDNQGQKISEAQGFKSLDLSKFNKDLKGLIPNGGVVNKEYYQKMSSGQEILILINFDPTKIPKGLLLQSIDDSVKSSTQLSHGVIDDLQKIGVKIGEIYYSRYNIKFVTQEMLGDKKADYQIHVNLLSGVDSGFTDHCNIFALGAKQALIVLSEYELGIDFPSILSHEIGHVMLFQHPMGTLSDLRVPSHMSYLIPMAQRPNNFNQVVANNILPIAGYTTADQKVLEIYMKLLGREPKITNDLTRKLDSQIQGLSGLYNPDGNFNNIVKISSEIFDKNFNIVLMTPREALTYCKMDDIFKCENSIGYDDAYAVIAMFKTTGTVKSMVILDGKNPKIKIDEEELIDIRDLLIKDGFSIIDFDADNEMRIYKYIKLDNSSYRNLTEANFLYDYEITEPKETESVRKISNLLGVGFFVIASVALVSAIQRGKSSSKKMPSGDIETGVSDHFGFGLAKGSHHKEQ